MNAHPFPGLSDVPFIDDEVDAARAYAEVPRGAFEVTTDTDGQRWFWFKCPGACGSIAPIALRPVVRADAAPSWEWGGSAGAPTLTPSIDHRGCWHGWLTDGVFRSC